MSRENGPAPRFHVHRASAPGIGGIAVVELFGAGAEEALSRAFRPRRGSRLPPARRARLGVLVARRGEAVDDVIVARFSARESWCGLPGWSVSCHGGPAVTDRVIGVLVAAGGRRATTAEVLDLALERGAVDIVRRQAFPLLVEAITERAARYFLRQWRGELGARLLDLLADLRVPQGRETALASLDDMVRAAPAACRLGEPLRILVAGRTNVGKSTLLNALLGSERVVVSGIPGTTRDLIAETVEIDGYPVTLIDSAGLRPEEAEDPVEREGIRRALEAPREAVLLLSDRDGPLAAEEAAFLDSVPAGHALLVRSKTDLRPSGRRSAALDLFAGRPPDAVCSPEPVDVSCAAGTGLDELREAVRSSWLGPPRASEVPAVPFTRDLVERTQRLRERWTGGGGPEALRRALGECFPGLCRPSGPFESEADDT